MKKTIAFLFVCAGVLFAQDGGEKVNVPLDNPSQAARVHVSLLLGSITVRGANTNEVTVEARSNTRGQHESSNTSGMHRLDLGGSAGLDIVEQDNVVTIKTGSWSRHADLVINVPRRSSLQLRTMTDGGIDVEQVDGEIDVDSLNGSIILKDVSGSVLAHTLNGEILATLDQVDPSKPMAFSTLNGPIDVTLPPNIRANVRMKTDNGDIYSDFDVNLSSVSHADTTNSGERRNGAYHIHIDRTLRGSINGGGPEYQFTSLNGRIFIRKKK